MEFDGKAVYSRLEALAREKGVRLSAMCDALGLRRALISDLKSGKVKSIGSPYIAAFARYLNTTMDYIYNGTRSDLNLSQDEQILLEAWRDATDDERENVCFILRRYGVRLPKEKPVRSSDLMTG